LLDASPERIIIEPEGGGDVMDSQHASEFDDIPPQGIGDASSAGTFASPHLEASLNSCQPLGEVKMILCKHGLSSKMVPSDTATITCKSSRFIHSCGKDTVLSALCGSKAF
jgi:hypothetical protein